MARMKKTRMDCVFNWATQRVKGYRILPPVTQQPIDNFCGAHAAVEVFEARARLLNARVNLPFPTLSILHLIDQIRDASANAVTAADRRRVASEESAFSSS
ncbi:hypothetical protein HU200_012703 [Digitaria exilis]|uniref:Uncharacterized protein n=1 Tax=Digitaria exilis TaxID=1010633 RepID=A0A835FEA6_9POAL|nr:hypothetical protein HU200_012703 [Digitaria exilis]